MGQLKKHKARDAIIAAVVSRTTTGQLYFGTTLKNVNGENKSASSKDYSEAAWLKTYFIYASSQEISSYDYDEGDLSSIKVGTLTSTQTQSTNRRQRSFAITISNSGSDSITVNSIKFCTGGTNGTVSNDVYLFYTYYLTAPLTIPAGETGYVNLVFDYSQPEPTVTQD